jgi:hypothetical protein
LKHFIFVSSYTNLVGRQNTVTSDDKIVFRVNTPLHGPKMALTEPDEVVDEADIAVGAEQVVDGDLHGPDLVAGGCRGTLNKVGNLTN